MRAGVAALAVLLLLSVTWAAGSSSPFTPSVTLVERTFDRPSCSLSTSLHIHAASSVNDVYSSLSTLLSELNSTISEDQLWTQNRGQQADDSLAAPQQRRHRAQRQLQDAVVLPPIELPPVEAVQNMSPPAFIILASNRTARKNPLQNFDVYRGGWDFFSADYWASLGWSTVYGAAIGVVWVLFGLGFLVFLLVICVCCRFKWRSLRDGNPKYGRKQLALPLIFMLFGVLLECVGLGLMVGGAVKLTNGVNGITSFTVGTVEKVSNVVLNITPILRRVADSKNVFNITVTDDVRQKLNEVATKADNLANTVLQKSQAAQSDVNNALTILQKILFSVGCITVGAVLVGLVFALCKWVIASNITVGFVWVLALVTWILVTVFLFVWLFGGDTSVALGQVAYSPTDLSKFNIIVPCMDPDAINDLSTFARFAAYTAITVANATISQEAPVVFTLLRAPQGICNPFGPAPNYTFYRGACENICNPNEQFCRGQTIDISSLADRFSGLKCNSTSAARCISVTTLTKGVGAVLLAARELASGVVDLIPALQRVLRCAYITYIATSIQGLVQGMETDALLMWLGFLFISVGAIFFSICAPIYVYRAVRAYGARKGSTELEPISPPILSHADSHAHVEDGYADPAGTVYATPQLSAGASESVESSTYVKGPGKPGATPWPSATQFDPPSEDGAQRPQGGHLDCDASSAPKYEMPSWSKK